MYNDRGLGLWSEIFTAGKTLLTTIGPSVLQYKLQSDAMRNQLRLQQAQNQANIPATSAAAPIQYVQQAVSGTLIPGIPNIVLIGGAALLLVALMNRRE